MTAPKKLSAYTDPTGDLPNWQLKAGSWYVRHKRTLRHIVIGVLASWSAITLGAGIYGWGRFLFVDYTRTQSLLAHLSVPQFDARALHDILGPRPVEIVEVDGFPGTQGGYDLIARVRNPNAAWLADVEYRFAYGRGGSESAHAILPPGQESIIVAAGQETDALPSDARVTLERVSWKRIDPHKIANPAEYAAKRLRFSADNVVFAAADIRKGLAIHSISFNATNDGTYDYWDARFWAVFESGGTAVGVAPVSLAEFRRGQSRSVRIGSLADRLRVDDVVLYPRINPFDENEFIPTDF